MKCTFQFFFYCQSIFANVILSLKSLCSFFPSIFILNNIETHQNLMQLLKGFSLVAKRKSKKTFNLQEKPVHIIICKNWHLVNNIYHIYVILINQKCLHKYVFCMMLGCVDLFVCCLIDKYPKSPLTFVPDKQVLLHKRFIGNNQYHRQLAITCNKKNKKDFVI